MNQYIIHTDGGARGNPGPAAIGAVIIDSENKKYTISKYIGNATNNSAEYEAVISAFEFLHTLGISKGTVVKMYLDSQLVVRQLKGLYKIKDSNLRIKHAMVKSLERQLNMAVEYFEIPRSQNSQADFLVNLALDKQMNLR